MPLFDGIRRALHIETRRTVRRAVDEELRFHLDMRVEELVRDGVARDRAREVALREFGDVADARDELTAMDRTHAARRDRARWWAELGQDVRFAARVLRRQPAFTLVVLLTLALGVGANTALFTVVDAALLRPLPYHEAGQLVHLWETRAKSGTSDDLSEASYPDFLDWRERSRALTAIEGYDPTNLTATVDGEPRMLRGGRVTAGFFSMLGVRPAAGRLFAAEEDVPGGTPVVVVSHGFWQRELSGGADAVGRTLQLDGRQYEIVGVLPSDFRFAPIGDAELWMPLDHSAGRRAERFNHWLNTVGRLRDGETPASAREDLGAVMRALAIEHPETNAGRGIAVVPLREQITGTVRPILLVLLGAVALVLCIACANVASLLLARTMARGREMAVRSALGASRARIARLVLTESVLLALAGGALGAWLARFGVAALVSAIPDRLADAMPYLRDVTVDHATLAYTFAIALATGIAFGLAPALYASRTSLAEVLAQGARGSSGRGRSVRNLLVSGEIALTLVLLVAAGLVGRSLVGLLRVDAGFETDRVLTMRVALSGSAYDSSLVQQQFFEQLTERVRALPGVRQVGAVTNLPLDGGGTNTFRAEGEPEPGTASRPEAVMRGVAGSYFQAMGIRLLAGRAFGATDRAGAKSAIVVSEALARAQFFSATAAVGRELRFYAFPESTWRIIGVVRDVKTARLDQAAPPTVYYTHLQAAENRLSLAVRVAGDPLALAAAVRREVRALDPAVAVYAVRSMEQQVAESPAVFVRRYPLVLIGAFAALALMLAMIGIYGVISYAVTQRTREMGIRLALGAGSADIVRLVLREGALLVGSGIVVGTIAALALARLLATLVYGVSVTDPATYLVVVALLTSVALMATWLPARRAARADPMIALRAE